MKNRFFVHSNPLSLLTAVYLAFAHGLFGAVSPGRKKFLWQSLPPFILLLGLSSFVHAEFTITTVAGGGPDSAEQGGCSADDGKAATAMRLKYPQGIAADSAGNLYIADTRNHCIRKVDKLGIVHTVAGDGTSGYNGDDIPAAEALLASPNSIALDSKGNLYIADGNNDRVRKVDAAGIITTIAGNGSGGYSGDGGPATAAQIDAPMGIVIDSGGTVYFASRNNDVIRKIDKHGEISTIAGNRNGNIAGYWELGDDGPASEAQLWGPTLLALDNEANLLIADMGNNRIRKIDADGIITTLAGNGFAGIFQSGYWGDRQLATEAEINIPHAVVADGIDNLYIADTGNNVIRKIDASGVINTVAGGRQAGFSGDGGFAADARLAGPFGLAIDEAGNLYIADTNNHRIRKIAFAEECEGRATYVMPGGELFLPFVDIVLSGELSGMVEALLKYIPALSDDLTFEVMEVVPAIPSPPAVPPCHAVYSDSDTALRVPFIDLAMNDEFGNRTSMTDEFGNPNTAVFRGTLELKVSNPERFFFIVKEAEQIR
ncbi:MAG: hypothetical protein GY862_06195 [Gammaproteobacteria bacterium]|nr:hypothetical protein [Gammaproteobacteria bacterium]